MRRTLRLRRETLTELGTDALAAVVAGNDTGGPQPTPPQHGPRTLVLEECFALSVYLDCGGLSVPRCA